MCLLRMNKKKQVEKILTITMKAIFCKDCKNFVKAKAINLDYSKACSFESHYLNPVTGEKIIYEINCMELNQHLNCNYYNPIIPELGEII